MNLRDWDATSSRFFHESTKWTLKKRMHHLFALFFESEHKCWWLQKDRDDGSGDTSRSESVSSFLKRSRAGSIWCKAAMGLDGMEAIAIAVVIGLFIVVLKQFGIWEPLSLEGNVHSMSIYACVDCHSDAKMMWNCSFKSAIKGQVHIFSIKQLKATLLLNRRSYLLIVLKLRHFQVLIIGLLKCGSAL